MQGLTPCLKIEFLLLSYYGGLRMRRITCIDDIDGLKYDEVCAQLAMWNQYCKRQCPAKSCNGCKHEAVMIELDETRKSLQINAAYYRDDVDNGVYCND
jgi:hypothetical protein